MSNSISEAEQKVFFAKFAPIVDKLFTEAFDSGVFGGAPFTMPEHNICVYVAFNGSTVACFKYAIEEHKMTMRSSLMKTYEFGNIHKPAYTLRKEGVDYHMIRIPHEAPRRRRYDENDENDEDEDDDFGL